MERLDEKTLSCHANCLNENRYIFTRNTCDKYKNKYSEEIMECKYVCHPERSEGS